MQSIITENREQIIALCRAHHVSRVFAFGSAVREDFDPETSDVDLLVDFAVPEGTRYSTNFFALEKALAQLLDRRVDVVVSETITNPFLLKTINEDKQLLYAA